MLVPPGLNEDFWTPEDAVLCAESRSFGPFQYSGLSLTQNFIQ